MQFYRKAIKWHAHGYSGLAIINSLFLRGVSEGRFSIVPAVADLNKKHSLHTLLSTIISMCDDKGNTVQCQKQIYSYR